MSSFIFAYEESDRKEREDKAKRSAEARKAKKNADDEQKKREEKREEISGVHVDDEKLEKSEKSPKKKGKISLENVSDEMLLSMKAEIALLKKKVKALAAEASEDSK